MTNQTIGGVSRELLGSLADYVADSPNAIMRARAKKLRALLDAPAPRAEFKKIEMAHVMNALEDVRGGPVLTSNQCHDLARALNDRLLSPLQLLAMPAEYLAAAQPQGEPVEPFGYWLQPKGLPLHGMFHRVTENDKVIYEPSNTLERFDAIALYAEQPAPVAPWFYFVECDDPDYSGLFNHESEAQTQANDHGGSVVKLWNVPPTWRPGPDQLSMQLERLRQRAWAVMQEAMDGARVHPCDERSEEAKVRTLTPIYQDLYASLTANAEQPATNAGKDTTCNQ